MYFFIFWLSQVLVAACSIFVVAHGLSCSSRDQSCILCIAERVLNYWIAKEVPCRLSLWFFPPYSFLALKGMDVQRHLLSEKGFPER